MKMSQEIKRYQSSCAVEELCIEATQVGQDFRLLVLVHFLLLQQRAILQHSLLSSLVSERQLSHAPIQLF